MAARWSGGSVARAARTSRVVSELPTAALGSAWTASSIKVAPPAPSSGSGTQVRTDLLRSRSREALTTMRCNQVVTADSPRKVAARR